MNELYWITQLDSICAVLLTVAIIGIIITVLFTIIRIVCRGLLADNGNKKEEYNTYWAKRSKNIVSCSAPIGFIAMILLALTPTTKQAYIIYGIGSTIDYLKQNEAAQRLPDKAIKALDSWVDYMTIEPADSTKNH